MPCPLLFRKTTVMKTHRLFITLPVVLLLAAACSKPVPETRSGSEFLKAEAVSFGELPMAAVEAMLYNGVPTDSTGQHFVFYHNKAFVTYDMTTHEFDIIDTGSVMHNRIAWSDDNKLWHMQFWNTLVNVTDSQRYTFGGTIPGYNEDFYALTYAQLPIIGNRIYTSLSTSLKKEDMPVDFRIRWDHAAIWTIEGGSIKFTKAFGHYPKGFPHDSHGSVHTEIIASPTDSIVMLFSDIMDNVCLFDLDGNDLGERYFGSQYFRTPRKLSYEEFLNQQTFIEWCLGNTLYYDIVYDPYRQVYLRPMLIPATQDEDAMEKGGYNFSIVVADRDLNIKYEVLLENVNPRTGAFILPTKEGVLIGKFSENDELQKADLYIFD